MNRRAVVAWALYDFANSSFANFWIASSITSPSAAAALGNWS